MCSLLDRLALSERHDRSSGQTKLTRNIVFDFGIVETTLLTYFVRPYTVAGPIIIVVALDT